MNKTDLAYLAGILDGEGCIHISKYKGDERHKTLRYTLNVQISMVDKSPLMLAQFAFGGYLRLRIRENTKWKPIWEWGLKSNKAVECLKDLLPYLRTKKAEAELGIKFCQEANFKEVGRIGKSDAQVAVQEADYILMKALKDKSRTS